MAAAVRPVGCADGRRPGVAPRSMSPFGKRSGSSWAVGVGGPKGASCGAGRHGQAVQRERALRRRAARHLASGLAAGGPHGMRADAHGCVTDCMGSFISGRSRRPSRFCACDTRSLLLRRTTGSGESRDVRRQRRSPGGYADRPVSLSSPLGGIRLRAAGGAQRPVGSRAVPTPAGVHVESWLVGVGGPEALPATLTGRARTRTGASRTAWGSS
jgi:hypothetical protein